MQSKDPTEHIAMCTAGLQRSIPESCPAKIAALIGQVSVPQQTVRHILIRPSAGRNQKIGRQSVLCSGCWRHSWMSFGKKKRRTCHWALERLNSVILQLRNALESGLLARYRLSRNKLRVDLLTPVRRYTLAHGGAQYVLSRYLTWIRLTLLLGIILFYCLRRKPY